jgi:hypothetical protein
VGKLGFRTVTLARPSLFIYDSLQFTVAEGNGSSTDRLFVICDFPLSICYPSVLWVGRKQSTTEMKNDK